MGEIHISELSSQQKTHLNDFIQKNFQICAVIGVFSAISVYFSKINSLLSLISLLIVFILSWELKTLLPKIENSSSFLFIFEILLLGFLMGLFFYILSEYRDLIITYSWIGFLLLYLIILLELLDRGKLDNLKNKIHNSKFIQSLFLSGWGEFIFRIVILIVDLVLSIISSYLLKLFLTMK